MKLSNLILFIFTLIKIPIFTERINENVLICGVCRNIANSFSNTTRIVENIGDLFNDYRVLIYENNSNDETWDLLKDWSNKNIKVHFLSEFCSYNELKNEIVNVYNGQGHFPDGKMCIPEMIARARNKIMDKIFEDQFINFPYIIWLDLDFDVDPCYEGFIDTFSKNLEWDAVFAYGVNYNDIDKHYWDWYAFRDITCPLGPELLGREWWDNPEKYRKLNLTKDDQWHRVYSAFGGCGIYRKEALKDVKYSAIINKPLEEHIKVLLENKSNFQVEKYFELNNSIKEIHYLEKPHFNLPEILDPESVITISQSDDPVLWRLNAYNYKYPIVCEHVTLHAAMILNGCDKLYINPKLVFYYVQ